LKDWANYTFCHAMFHNILEDLRHHYHYDDAIKIYIIAIIKVCYPGAKDYEIQFRYEESFLSEIFPGVSLSRTTVSRLMNDLGKAYSKIVAFMRERTERVETGHHLLIDGILKTNDSKVNTLSNFSRKSRIKGQKEISVLYSFDLELMEPICCKCFPGNMIDGRSYSSFISENGIKRGLIVADKGFPANAAEEEFRNNPDLHYLNPIKRNSKFISTHKLYDYEGILEGYEGGITFKKAKCIGVNKWLYSFRDTSKAAKEEKDYLRRSKENGDFDLKAFKEKQNSFGTLIFECDLDMEPEAIFKAYSCRWEIEVVAKYYKSACEFNETNVHDDYSVIGREFCDFLSTLLTFKLLNRFDKLKILKDMTYGNAMEILARAKKVKIKDEWKLIRMNLGQIEVLQKLEILPPNPTPESGENRKPGRPRKNPI